MKKLLFILSLTVIFFLCVDLFANRKIVIAVPDFEADGLAAQDVKIFTDTLLTSFESTGRVVTKSSEDIKLILAQMQQAQTFASDNCSDEACQLAIGQRMQVDYIVSSRVVKSEEKYVITIRLLKILGEVDIPTVMFHEYEHKKLGDIVRNSAVNIAMRFPLEGKIEGVIGDRVIVNLGENYLIKKGDTFNVVNITTIGGYREKEEVAELLVEDVQPNSSKASVKSGLFSKPKRALRTGDNVVLNQNELLKRLESDRIENEKRAKNAADRRESEKKSREWHSSLNNRSSLFRIGYGIPEYVKMQDEEMNNYYGSGIGYMLDWFIARGRDHGGDGFDMYFRGIYKTYEMADESFVNLLDSGNVTGLAAKSSLAMYGLDWGIRYSWGFVLFERFDFYMLGAVRTQFTVEKSDNVELDFWSYGLVYGGGIELTLFPGIGLFGECNMGYHGIGEPERNVDGLQVFAGITFRTYH